MGWLTSSRNHCPYVFHRYAIRAITRQGQPVDPQRFGPLGDRLRAMLGRTITFQVISFITGF
jgi:hypothetical protein